MSPAGPMPKPSEADRSAFLSLVPDRPDVTVKPMFGSLGAFVNGNMFMGLFGSSIGLRLGDADRELLLAEEGAGPFGPPGRPMGGYVSLPDAWRDPEPEFPSPQVQGWVARAVEHAAALPPKKPRGR